MNRFFTRWKSPITDLFLEQDNAKIIRGEEGDQIICWEKGMEKFFRGDYDCTPAEDYWKKKCNLLGDGAQTMGQRLPKTTKH